MKILFYSADYKTLKVKLSIINNNVHKIQHISEQVQISEPLITKQNSLMFQTKKRSHSISNDFDAIFRFLIFTHFINTKINNPSHLILYCCMCIVRSPFRCPSGGPCAMAQWHIDQSEPGFTNDFYHVDNVRFILSR